MGKEREKNIHNNLVVQFIYGIGAGDLTTDYEIKLGEKSFCFPSQETVVTLKLVSFPK